MVEQGRNPDIYNEEHRGILQAIEKLQAGQNKIITMLWKNVKVGSGDKKRIVSYHPVSVRIPVSDGNGNGHVMNKCFIQDHKAILDVIKDLKGAVNNLRQQKRIIDLVALEDQQMLMRRSFTENHEAILDAIEDLQSAITNLQQEQERIIGFVGHPVRNPNAYVAEILPDVNGNRVEKYFIEDHEAVLTAITDLLCAIRHLQDEQKRITDRIANYENERAMQMGRGFIEDHKAILDAINDLQAAITELQQNLHVEQERINNNINRLGNNPAPANRILPIDDTNRFLEDLYKNIKDMTKHTQVLDQLVQLQENLRNEIVQRATVDNFFRNKPENMTLLQLVANCENPAGEHRLLLSVLQMFPEQLLTTPTVIHILVYNRNIKGARIVLRRFDINTLRDLLSKEVNDEKYEKTRMMGKKALFIAALSFDNKMVDLLIRKGAKVDDHVSGGNAVFHLLVKYAELYPESQVDVNEMMEKLNGTLQNERQLSLWYKANDKGQTVLQQAALKGQHELFKWMLELEGVYIKHEEIFGHVECVRFDITELDYVALNRFRKSNSRNTNCFPTWCNRIHPEPNAVNAQETGNTPSVIEIICMSMKSDKAYNFINIPPIDDIIDKKLNHYKRWLIFWFILHLVIMALLAAQAVVKALLINDSQQLMSNTQAITFEFAARVLLFVLGIIYLVLEGLGVYNRLKRSFFHDKRNWDYHVLLIVFSFCLIIDSIWSWIRGPQNIYFLAIALVVGGWFLPFFLRPWKFFSVFTAMARSVLMKDTIRFVLIIFFDFVAFSFAMYVLYLQTPGGPPAEFEHLGMAVLTMFTLMLGLTDLEILTRAPFPWLTVTLFIIFIVLTYILMFNILIALMTSTFKNMSKNRDEMWKLQRLAVVVMIEHMLPLRYAFDIGELGENNQRYFSKCFYYEKQALLMFKKWNKALMEARDKITSVFANQ